MANQQAIKISPIHEQIILGSMLRDPKIRIKLSKFLNPSDFYLQEHRAIFAALQELTVQKLEYVPSTLKAFLPPDAKWGGMEYITKLENSASEKNIEFHIKRAKWDTVRNTLLVDKIPELQALLQDPRVEPVTIHNALKQYQLDIIQDNEEEKIITGKSHVAKYNAKLYARQSGISTRTSGYLSLDKKLTSPFHPGWITLVAAAPSIGKTTFCLNMAARQAYKWRVGYLAWETGTTAATDIICASQLKIPLENLLKYPERITKEDHERKDKLLYNLFEKNSNLSFLPLPPKSVRNKRYPWEVNDAILDWLDETLEEWNIDILYWDLFERKMADKKPNAITWALDRSQEIFKLRNVHGCILNQINLKDLENREDKRPTRGIVKGTGGYTEVADFVFGLHRRAVYERGIEDNELELYCLKQRYGQWPFRIIFEWDGMFCRVGNGHERQMTFLNDDDNYDDV